MLLQENFNIHQYRARFIELCRREAQPGPFSYYFSRKMLGNPISFIVTRSELHTMTDEELLFPYLFVSVAYRSTIDPRACPFSFYTYLIRKGVSGQSETRRYSC